MVVWGAYQAVGTVFNAADASMGLMATINLIGILLLSGTVAKLTKDYLAQRKTGVEPVFRADEYPELKECAALVKLGLTAADTVRYGLRIYNPIMTDRKPGSVCCAHWKMRGLKFTCVLDARIHDKPAF